MAKVTNRLMRGLDRIARRAGHRVVRERQLVDFYLHEFDSYEQYRDVQIRHNIRKINNVWADEATLGRVADIAAGLVPEGPVRGLCHGTRNGFEQKFLNACDPRFDVLGTDISETAKDYDNSVQWDFHDENPEWAGHFDFIYTNSLDQSWQPKRALETWFGQVRDGGAIILEHTEAHGPMHASEMDPFGVRPVAMPYVLTDWFGDQITIRHSVARKSNMDRDAWLFVISKRVSDVRVLAST